MNSQRIISLSAQGTLASSTFLEHACCATSECVSICHSSSCQVCNSLEHLQVLPFLPLHIFTLMSASHYELPQDLI